MKKVAVVGLGNILMSDDGFGVRVIEDLEKRGDLPEFVTLIQAETAGIAILPHVEGADVVIMVDAVDCDATYGEVKVFSDHDISAERGPVISMHEAGARDLVSAVRLSCPNVPRLILVGTRPKNVSFGMQMTPEVTAAVGKAVGIVVQEIARPE